MGERIQGYKRLSAFWVRCVSCGARVIGTKAETRAHEQTLGHKQSVGVDTPTASPVFPALAAFWVPWQLAPDSDPEQRFILTTADGEREHPAGVKFSSSVEAYQFLKNNPQVDTARAVQQSDSAKLTKHRCDCGRLLLVEGKVIGREAIEAPPTPARLSELVDGTPDEINATVEHLNNLEAPCAGCGHTPQTCTCLKDNDYTLTDGSAWFTVKDFYAVRIRATSDGVNVEIYRNNDEMSEPLATATALDADLEPLTDDQMLNRIGSFGYGVYRILGQYVVADPEGGDGGYILTVPTIEDAFREMDSAGLLDSDQWQPPHTGELLNGLVATVERAEKGGKP